MFGTLADAGRLTEKLRDLRLGHAFWEMRLALVVAGRSLDCAFDAQNFQVQPSA